MTWDEHKHPRWPAHTPDSRGGEFHGDSPGGWLGHATGPHPGDWNAGRMTHTQLRQYVGRTDYQETPLAGGNSSFATLRTYPDGTVLVHKFHTGGEMQQHTEVKASHIGWAVGAPVPAVVYDTADPGATLSEYVPGELAVTRMPKPADQSGILEYIRQERQLAASIEGGLELGLLDLLIGNTDRHTSNWLIDQDGRAVGIDHANADIGWPTSASPFSRQFRDGNGHYIDHPMPKTQIGQIQDRLAKLAQNGTIYDSQYRDMVAILEKVAAHARSLW